MSSSTQTRTRFEKARRRARTPQSFAARHDVDDATAQSGTVACHRTFRAVHRNPSRAVRVQEAPVDAWNIQGVVGGGF